MTLNDEKNDERLREVTLDWRDYVALVIAALETVLLPFLIVIVALVVLWYVIKP